MAEELKACAHCGENTARFEAAWREMYDELVWLQGCKALPVRYLGMNLAAVASDLITRAYPELRNGRPVPPHGSGPPDTPSPKKRYWLAEPDLTDFANNTGTGKRPA